MIDHSRAIATATGGQRSRDIAQLRNMPGRWCLYGTLGTLSHEFDAGGPIDAPDIIPAGCMDSTSTTNSQGHPIPWASETRREVAP